MISVIIPAYNEKYLLLKCIESLGSQTISDFEVIVVDDGSTDGTLKMLQETKKTIPDFNYFTAKHGGAGAARNLGARSAKGDIFVFVDADMTFDKDFLKMLTAPIKEGKTKGTWSREEYVANWDNVWARCWNLNEGWMEKRRHPKNYPDTQPVFRAILASEFKKVGGFTPGGYMDDWSLGKKLGYLAQNAPGAVFYHKNPSGLGEIFSHAVWVGKRDYKLGVLGYVFALIRSSLLVSVIIGLYKSIVNLKPEFLIFKLVYDLGIFTGIVEMLLFGKLSK